MSDKVFQGEHFHMPIIRLSVERMGESVTQALAVYNQEVSQHIEDGIEQAVRTFDFDVFVRKEAHKALQKAVESYFQYGEGARIMEGVVNRAMSNMGLENEKESEK